MRVIFLEFLMTWIGVPPKAHHWLGNRATLVSFQQRAAEDWEGGLLDLQAESGMVGA